MDEAAREDKYKRRGALLSLRLTSGNLQHETIMRTWLMCYVRGRTTGAVYPFGRFNDPTHRQDEGCLGCFGQLGPRRYLDRGLARLTYCKSCTDCLFDRIKLSKSLDRINRR